MPLVGLEDVISHIETLTDFTQQVLNDTNQAISLLTSEVSTMRKKCYKTTWPLTSLQQLREAPVP